MVAILSIMALIMLISVYDYVSSRKWQQVTADDRNELVFTDRNREYGAYQIRKGYNNQLMMIVLSTVFAIGSAYGIYVISKKDPKKKPEPPPEVMAQLTMDPPKVEEPLDPPTQQEVPEMEKTVQFLPPEVTDDEDQAVEPPPQNLFNDAASGSQTHDGDGIGGGDPPPPPPPPPPPNDKPEIHTYVDEPAAFNGNVKQYLADNIKYPQTAIELGIEGKCYLQFIVSASGNISNVEVKRGVPDCPECDKEAVRVVKSMPAWKPGKIGGKAVHSTFNLPVTFKLQ